MERRRPLKRSAPMKRAPSRQSAAAKGNARRQRKRAVDGWFNAVWPVVWDRDHGRCLSCGRPARTIPACLHHVLPKQRWPELAHDPQNVILVCEDCHSKHETGFTRLPREVCVFAELLGLDDRQLAYLDRIYGKPEPSGWRDSLQ